MRSREPIHYVFCAVLLSSVFLGLGTAADSHHSREVRYEATWESLMRHNATPQWYEDAVLGFYFHWGPYSVPGFGCAGYWAMYMPGEQAYRLVKRKYGEPGIEFGYKDFIPLWKAPKYDPDEWAALFKYAGADFAGPAAEHHDGLCLELQAPSPRRALVAVHNLWTAEVFHNPARHRLGSVG